MSREINKTRRQEKDDNIEKRLSEVEERMKQIASASSEETVDSMNFIIGMSRAVHQQNADMEQEFRRMQSYYAAREETIKKLMGEKYAEWKKSVDDAMAEMVRTEMAKREAEMKAQLEQMREARKSEMMKEEE